MRDLERSENSAEEAQLAYHASSGMHADGDDPFAKVNGLIINMNARCQKKACETRLPEKKHAGRTRDTLFFNRRPPGHHSKGLHDQDCEELHHINKQSPDIAGGVRVAKDDLDVNAGDQGIMFGYAIDETEDAMPLTHSMTMRSGKKLNCWRRWWSSQLLRVYWRSFVRKSRMLHDGASHAHRQLRTRIVPRRSLSFLEASSTAVTSILKQMKDSKWADLSADDKAEEARKGDNARLVSAKKEEIATLTIVIGTKVTR